MKLNNGYVLKGLFAVLAIALITAALMNAGIFWKNEGTKEIGSDKPDAKPVPVQEKIIVPKVIYNLSGKIKKIDGNTIVFNAEIFSVDEKGERSVLEEERRAIVNSQTKVSSLSFVDRSPVKKEIKPSTLKPGDYVDILSGSDISNAEEFLASQITLKPSM